MELNVSIFHNMVSFSCFLVEVGLFNCNPVLRGTRNLPQETLSTAASFRLTRGLQLHLEIA
jgi:hypothetical protein